MSYMLRLKTYLTPSMPQEFYLSMIKYRNKKLGTSIQLMFETHRAGPDRNKPDPFSLYQIDIGHFCASSYIWLSRRNPSPVELLSVIPIFKDARAKGRPVYFADVIVNRKKFINRFEELKGKTWGYSNEGSESGYYSVLQKLSKLNQTPSSFFKNAIKQDSHVASIQNVVAGTIDGASIDSNVLSLRHKQDKNLKHQIKIIETWGPFPLQPFVIRKGFDKNLKQEITQALQEMNRDPKYKKILENNLIEGFNPVYEKDFESGKKLLEACKDLRF